MYVDIILACVGKKGRKKRKKKGKKVIFEQWMEKKHKKKIYIGQWFETPILDLMDMKDRYPSIPWIDRQGGAELLVFHVVLTNIFFVLLKFEQWK